MSRRRKRGVRWTVVVACVLALALVGPSACGSGEGSSSVDPAASVVALPGAMREVDFDDIGYSERLGRVLVPARRSGLYLVDPASGEAERVGHVRSADSADEGDGLVFVLDRDSGVLNVLDPALGRVVSSVGTAGAGDYVRYVRPPVSCGSPSPPHRHRGSRSSLWPTGRRRGPDTRHSFRYPTDRKASPGAPRPGRSTRTPAPRS